LILLLETESRTSCMLTICSSTELHPQLVFSFSFLYCMLSGTYSSETSYCFIAFKNILCPYASVFFLRDSY
jgi:hypothetical protein